MPKFLLSLILIFMTSLMWSQESQQEKLEKRKAQIQQEIRDNERLLLSVKKKEKSAVSVVIVQTNKIKLKEKLINTTEKQARLLSNDIYINQLKINKLNRELVVLKEDYSKMIVKSYKSRSEQSRAMFILSSNSFLQAYKRAQYMKQYTGYRKMQGVEIKSKSDELTDYNEKLDVQKSAKQKLIQENEKERLSLLKAKQEQDKLVKLIKKDKNKIATDIKKKQQEARAIDRQIDRIIREAIAEANRKAALEKAMRKAEAEAKAGDTKEEIKTRAKAIVSSAPAVSSSKIVLTPEEKILADNFKSNRGKLPWPVEKGFVSLPYGDQQHPQFPALRVHNSGVEITTESGSTARAVFAGEVTSVMVLSPVNKAVMIQHGDYFTVYQNLSSVNVSKGDKVNIKQSIGKVRTNGETGRTVLKFTISQNTTYNNPASWLYNM
ncbi:peptidoglycan DD-metalloendopeptidase family protein [Flavobacterium franklandianum]|uniref:murein hydrolase activator EnvC family protein n=1 Tax=Flavobacterium franklandianum TaxID=2594430 RepID=UPI00117A8FF2|nr:peptidoglycan DD-metalloendopeptidase family protein [Flavobacterium franklandianum]TRX24517.1 peptidoglycan DD-metalloendopeptidase family protein [Flavobacterium franklandianum]